MGGGEDEKERQKMKCRSHKIPEHPRPGLIIIKLNAKSQLRIICFSGGH